jgi:hypothetical protein
LFGATLLHQEPTVQGEFWQTLISFVPHPTRHSLAFDSGSDSFVRMLRLYDPQSKLTLEWIKIAISVQERIALKQAKRRNPTIRNSPNCESLSSQSPEVLRGLDGELDSSSGKYFKFQELRPDCQYFTLIPNAL